MFDLKDPEVKKAFDAAIAEQLEAVKAEADEAVNKLKTNNKKLLDDLREARKSREIDPVEHQKLEEQVAALSEQLETERKGVTKTTSELTKQVETLTKQLASETAHTHTLLVDNGLTEALVKSGVEAHYIPAAKALLKGQVQIVADGETRKAVISDKPLGDFVGGWAQSDEGKYFVKAPANGGGGSNGGSANAGGMTVINASDSKAISANLEAIASGKAQINTD